jgi:uncharacterized membrane protein
MAYKKIVGIVLIILGAYLCFLGNQRRTSLAGGLEDASAKVAGKIDGAAHVSDATWYLVAGGGLVVLGVFRLLRSNPR